MDTRPGESSGFETLLLALLAASLVLCGLIWLLGQAAALMHSGRPLHLSFAETVTVAVTLKAHLSDPAAAWPAHLRPQLPGPVGFYAVAGVLLALVVAVCAGVVNLLARWGRKPPAAAGWARPGAGRWSHARDVAELRLDGGASRRALRRLVGRWLKVAAGLAIYFILYQPTRALRRGGRLHSVVTESAWWCGLQLGRKRVRSWWDGWKPVVIVSRLARAVRTSLRQEVVAGQYQDTRLVMGASGHRGGHLLAAEARHSVVVFGPTQMLKTAGVVIPALLEWVGPTMATSVKPDVVQTTCRHRQTRGEVWIYDPTGGLGRTGDTWSPLASCGEWETARKMGQWLTAAGASSQNRDAVSEFFEVLGSKFVGPLLFAAAHDDRPMRQVLSWINRGEEKEPALILEQIGDEAACESFEAHCRREERFKGNVVGTAEVILDVYNDPAVARSAESSRIDPGRLLEGDNTLYLYAPEHEQDRLRPLFEALMQEVMRVAIERAASFAGQLEYPFLVLLDEAAHIAPLRNLAKLANTVAAANIQLVSIWHDLAQLRARYGPLADSVVNGHRAKLLLPGISDPATLEYLSRLIGQAEYGRRSVSRGRGWGNVTTTDAGEFRDLAPIELLRQLPRGAAVLLYGNKPPVYLNLRPWFGDRILRERGAASLEHW